MDANAKKGEILVVNTFGLDEELIRKKAKVEEALEVLMDQGLMRDKRGKGEVFSLTNLGWEVSDGLKTE